MKNVQIATLLPISVNEVAALTIHYTAWFIIKLGLRFIRFSNATVAMVTVATAPPAADPVTRAMNAVADVLRDVEMHPDMYSTPVTVTETANGLTITTSFNNRPVTVTLAKPDASGLTGTYLELYTAMYRNLLRRRPRTLADLIRMIAAGFRQAREAGSREAAELAASLALALLQQMGKA